MAEQNYKTVTVLITLSNFTIKAGMDENEAILEALAKDIINWDKPVTEEGIANYFSDFNINIWTI